MQAYPPLFLWVIHFSGCAMQDQNHEADWTNHM